MHFPPRIQIAGIRNQQEAQMLLDEGVDDLGFPLGPGVVQEDISETEAAEIISTLASEVSGVLITYLNQAQEIFEFCRRLGSGKVQLHGDISTPEAAKLKSLAPHLFVMKSLVVRPEGASTQILERQMTELTPFIDAFITDTYDPATGQKGATGKVHDWKVSQHLVAISSRPIILAGGLNPENVAEAIRQVKPAAVDSHTGVEAIDGSKDREKVRAFVDRAREAFRLIPRQ